MAASGEARQPEVAHSFRAHDLPVGELTYDHSGGLLATCDSGGAGRVWDVDGGFCTHSFVKHEGVVLVLAFHPDVKRLLLVSAGQDSLVQVGPFCPPASATFSMAAPNLMPRHDHKRCQTRRIEMHPRRALMTVSSTRLGEKDAPC